MVFRSHYFTGKCGGDYTEENGHISSPSYPKPYPLYADCNYTISQANETYLLLKVLDFSLYTRLGEEGCENYLEIRDGTSERSPVIGKFCANNNIPYTIQSTQSKIRMR